jgi:hypothetical protein
MSKVSKLMIQSTYAINIDINPLRLGTAHRIVSSGLNCWIIEYDGSTESFHRAMTDAQNTSYHFRYLVKRIGELDNTELDVEKFVKNNALWTTFSVIKEWK